MHLNQVKLNLLTVVSWQDTWEALKRFGGYLNYRQPIGSIEVSVASLVQGFLVLILALLAARTSSKLIERRFAKRQYIDPGIRYTVARLTHYLIITLGILLALKLGFSLDLTSIAVLFTALSVGIGFGLQYLAADFASGFILLFERPIRVGDHVTIGKDEGDVQSINLRTTVVLTSDRTAMIMPNSKLVRDRIINWSYGQPRAAVSILIRVAPGADVDKVRDTLMQSAAGVEDILPEPGPHVRFLNIGDSSLDFQLRVWTSNPRSKAQIRSDINYRIEKLFRQAGIAPAPPKFDLR